MTVRNCGSLLFKRLPCRWITQLSLARDYEHTTSASETMAYIASIRPMLNWLQIDLRNTIEDEYLSSSLCRMLDASFILDYY